MTLREIEPQLLALSVAEKAQAIQILLKSIGNIETGIEKTPGVCGGDARIANTRIPDDEVLAFATQQERAVLTLNRRDLGEAEDF